MNHKYSLLGAGVLMLFWLLSPLLSDKLSPHDYIGGRSRDLNARQVRNSSAIGNMLGEFRTGMGDIMLLKTERYLHNGVGFQAHMTEVLAEEVKEVNLNVEQVITAVDHTCDEHCDHDHVEEAHVHDENCNHEHVHDENCNHGDGEGGYVTLIPGQENDYRGIIGSLHRKVKPWHGPNDPHVHTEGTELLPWFRVLTLSDPRHVRGYAVGGYWLSREDSKASEKFLLEGIRNNKQAFQLHLMLAKVYFNQARELDGDLYHPTGEQLVLALKARNAYRKAAELALQQRPHLKVTEDEGWTQADEDDAWAAYRMAVLTEKQYGEIERALDFGTKIIKTAGPDEALMRVLSTTQSPTLHIPQTIQSILNSSDS